MKTRTILMISAMLSLGVLFLNTSPILSGVNLRASSNRPKPLSGSLISISGGQIRGWAMNTEEPDISVRVQVDVNGVSLPVTTASVPDTTVAEIFESNPRHGFVIAIPAGTLMSSARVELFAVEGPVRQLLQSVLLTGGQL